MQADIVRLGLYEIDLKIVNDDQMHVLQWRRRLFWDEVRLDGRLQVRSAGIFGREKVYGLVFGQDLEGNGGERVMLVIDANPDHWTWTSGQHKVSGVRLERVDGPVLAYGTLDPKSLQKPDTFSDWIKKSMGMEWGSDRRS